MGMRTGVAGLPDTDMATMYRLWCRLGLALLCAAMAYDGRAEGIREEGQGCPRLEAAAGTLGVGLSEARAAVMWLLGEGESQGQGELALGGGPAGRAAHGPARAVPAGALPAAGAPCGSSAPRK